MERALLKEKGKETMKSKDMQYYIKSVIGLVIMFGFGQLPPIGPLTPLGMRIVGLFVGLVFLL